MQAMMLQPAPLQDVRPVTDAHAAALDDEKVRAEKTDEQSNSAAAVKDGSSFLSIIQEMLAGAMEGTATSDVNATHNSTISGTEESAAALKNKKLLSQKANATLSETSAKKDVTNVQAVDLQAIVTTKKTGDIAKDKSKNSLNGKDEILSNVKSAELETGNPDVDLLAGDRMGADTETLLAMTQHAKEKPEVERKSAKLHDGQATSDVAISGTHVVQQQAADTAIPHQRKVMRKASADNRITVEDLRTTTGIERNGTSEMRVSSGGSTVEMSLYLPENASNETTGISAAQKNGGKEQSFATLLGQSVQNAVPEIVQNGSIILRDNNQGTINLTLHPDSLGTVKISLKITENQVTGHIVTASEESFEAFKSNIQSLEAAFTENGFESAGFELGYSGSDNQQNEQRQDSGIIFGNRNNEHLASRQYTGAEITAAYDSAVSSLINVVA